MLKQELKKLFPDAKCELNYHNIFELSIAVILSAQTTDKSVNLVTPTLFKKYPTLYDLSNANVSDVEQIIKSIGLYKRKSQLIIDFSKTVISNFNGVIPNNIEDLVTIPGVGRKTANVIVSEGYKLPGLAVDVHVSRVSKRLGLVPLDYDVVQIEHALKEMFDKSEWHEIHHLLIFMGRYKCKAQKPNCLECPFISRCTYHKNR